MKKYIGIIMILLFSLSACTLKTNNSSYLMTESKDVYKAERCINEDFFCRMRVSGENAGVLYSAYFNRDDKRNELLYYDYKQNVTKVVSLELGEQYLYYMNCLRIENNGDISGLFFCVDDSGKEVTTYNICTFDANGVLLNQKDYTKIITNEMEDDTMPSNTILMQDGKMLFSYSDKNARGNIVVVSKDGNLQNRFSFEHEVIDIQEINTEYVLVLVDIVNNNGEQYASIYKLNIETGNKELIMEHIFYQGKMRFAKGKDMERTYIISNVGICECILTDDSLISIITIEEIGLTNGYDIADAIQADDETWYILGIMDRDEGEYNYFYYNWLRISNGEPEQERIKVSLAVVGNENLYRDEIIKFNKLQDNVKIELKQYGHQDILLAEMATGKFPDMIVLNENVDVGVLLAKDILTDLTVYLNEDQEIMKECFLEQALQIYADDYAIYAIPNEVIITTMIGNSDLLYDYEKWDLKEFIYFIDNIPNQNAAISCISRYEMLEYIMMQYLGDFIDYQEGTCNFENELFYEILDFVKLYPYESIIEGVSFEELLELIQNAEIALIPVEIGDITDLEMFLGMFSGKGKFIGYPVSTGDGICILPVNNAIAITEYSMEKDVAWEFLKFLYMEDKEGRGALPTNKEIYQKLINDAKKNSTTKEPAMVINTDKYLFEVPHVSIAQIEEFDAMVQNAKPGSYMSESIRKIILEEVEAFFSDAKKKEEVAKLIQNRVNLYLNEQH